MPFTGFEPQERMNLPRPFLKVVVAQVRFPHLYELEEPGELVATIQKELAREYPRALPREEQLVAISIGSPPPGQRPPGRFGPYRFKSVDDAWLVSLAPDFIAVEASSYEDYDVFAEHLERVLLIVAGALAPGTVERVGLRYVNEVPLESPDEWRALFTSDLLGLAADDAVAGRVVQEAAQLTVSLDDHYLTARHGLALEDSVAKAYVLDLDAFVGPSGSFDVQTILSTTTRLKSTCWSFFRAVVTDEFLRKAGAL